MNLEERIRAFEQLGTAIRDYLQGNGTPELSREFNEAIELAGAHNAWFTRDNVLFALSEIGRNLTGARLRKWLLPYKTGIEKISAPKTIGVVMAGNVPAVGFHDFLCVLISGHYLQVKLSHNDRQLIPFLAKCLFRAEPRFEPCLFFAERLEKFDAIIATGSNNASRYFDYYFGRYPHLIRRNRNGVAVLTGNESEIQLKGLCEDIFRYFGLGCRSVSKLYVPDGYDFGLLFHAMQNWQELRQHHKYMSNYQYYRVFFSLTDARILDNGFVMLKHDTQIASPVSVLHYEFYETPGELIPKLRHEADKLQCIVAENIELEHSVSFGCSQRPELWDYADNTDTLEFLLSL